MASWLSVTASMRGNRWQQIPENQQRTIGR
jgi:hypothetical protein